MPLAYDQSVVPQASIDDILKLASGDADLKETKLNAELQQCKMQQSSSNNSSSDFLSQLTSDAESKVANAYQTLSNTNTAKDTSKSDISSTALSVNAALGGAEGNAGKDEDNSFFSSIISKVNEIAKDKNKINDIKNKVKISEDLIAAAKDPNKLQSEIAKILKNNPDTLPANLKSALAALDKILCGDVSGAILNSSGNAIANALSQLTDLAALSLFSCNVDITKVSSILSSYAIKTLSNALPTTIGGTVLSATGSKTAAAVASSVIGSAVNKGKIDVKTIVKEGVKVAKSTGEDKSIITMVKNGVKTITSSDKADKLKTTKADDTITNKNILEVASDMLGDEKYNGSKDTEPKKDLDNNEVYTPYTLAKTLVKETTGDENTLDQKPQIDTTTKLALLTGINNNKNIA